jgi:2-dehydropantoate 2-reductase
LGAVCGLTLGEMLSIKKIREIFIGIMREAMAVADAMGLTVEIYAGKLDYYKFLKKEGFLKNFKRHLVIYLIGFKYRKIKSSSLQSLERGKPTEIDYLNGYIAEKGRRLGVSTPINDRIIQIIKEIEVGKRKISIENFNDPVFSLE